MWAPADATRYRDTYQRPHKATARLEVWEPIGFGTTQTYQKLIDLPVIAGEVRATLGSRVTRTASFVLDESWFPWEDTDPLAPFGNQVRAWRGVQYGDGTTEEWPIFVGRIQNVGLRDDGSMSINASDPAADVVDNQFERPFSSITSSTIVSETKRIITDAVPGAVFGPFDDVLDPVPLRTWDTDRGQALDDLAVAGGAFWYCLSDGSYVLRFVPWAEAEPASTAVTLKDGDGGTITASNVGRSREQAANSITGLLEPIDGVTAPTRYTARDLNSASPTYFFGRFGRVNRTLKIELAQTAAQLKVATDTLLKRSLAITNAWSVSCVPDATLELGDAVTLEARGRRTVQCIAGYTMPLTVTGAMSIQFRSFTPGIA